MKTAADQDGSAFVKEARKKVDDVSFLSQNFLKRTLGKNNSHLVRRPGVGLSEAAGSVQSGTEVLQNFEQLDFKLVTDVLIERPFVGP